MYKAIFTRISHKTRKYPKRIKTFTNTHPEYYLYQNNLTDWENYALACQHFCKINNIQGKFYGALDKDGMVFIKINEFYCVDETTTFYEE